MKSQKLLPALAVLFLTLINAFGQETPQAQLVDSFGKLCSEEFLARNDAFLVGLQNNPTATGYIVFYGANSLEGKNLIYLEILKNHSRMRKFDSTRIKILRGENRDEMQVEFWIVPAGASAPTVDQEYKVEKITAPMLFDNGYADFYKLFGKLAIYDDSFFYDWGCGISPNRKDFAKTLLSNPELTGYLVVYTKFGKGVKRGNQMAAFAVRDLTKNYKIQQNRLKTIYGGNRREPEIEFWFVPKGDRPPAPTPDKMAEK